MTARAKPLNLVIRTVATATALGAGALAFAGRVPTSNATITITYDAAGKQQVLTAHPASL